MSNSFKKLFGKNQQVLIGMIHLLPLMGVEGSSGTRKICEKALSDLHALEAAGFDAALLENDDDRPHTEFATSAQVASFSVVATEVCRVAKIPIGVQVMLNDWKASFAIAEAAGAQFTRLDVFVDHVTCEWCEINPDPKEIISYRDKISPNLVLLTDIQVKYKTMIEPRSLVESARLAVDNGSDALVITGVGTGIETPIEGIIEVRQSFPDFPILVGAGINEENIAVQLKVANGAIVGTSIKKEGKVSKELASRLRTRLT